MSIREAEPIEADDAGSVLAGLAVEREAATRAEARKMAYAAAWLALHSGDSVVPGIEDWHERLLPIGGEGCPRVREFCIAEAAAVLGLSTESGRRYLTDVAELYYRLRRCYARIQAGELEAWRGRMIAQRTLCLPPAAATWVDRQVAPVAHQIGPAALARLIEAAKATVEVEETELDRLDAAEHRHVEIATDPATPDGLVPVHALLDLPDALDLDAALRRGAEDLRHAGSTDSLDVRRAQALGLLARGELPLPTDDTAEPDKPDNGGTGGSRRARRRTGRQAVLVFHLSDSATHGMARVEQTRSLITLEQLTEWYSGAGAQVTIKPVLDLADARHVEAYEIPDTLRTQIELRDQTCAFPGCHRPAATADLDHINPHAAGGATSSDNLAPLCRPHHRLKTHAGWTYTMLEPTLYLWRSPHGHRFLKDAGTTTLLRETGPPT